MAMIKAEIQALTGFISPERLSKLLVLTRSPEAALDIHQETLRVGASLMTVIATLEISLRNSICTNLTQHFGIPNWLLHPPNGFRWREHEKKNINKALANARKAEYSKLSQAEKHALDALAYPAGRPAGISHASRAKSRQQQIQVTDGKVIAELTLYFWKRLYGPEYDQSLWRPSLKRTFPDKQIKRPHIATQLEHIYQSRNRLAHHEPVLFSRFEDTLNAIVFVVQNLEISPPNARSPLAQLLEPDLREVAAKAAALHTKIEGFRNP